MLLVSAWILFFLVGLVPSELQGPSEMPDRVSPSHGIAIALGATTNAEAGVRRPVAIAATTAAASMKTGATMLSKQEQVAVTAVNPLRQHLRHKKIYDRLLANVLRGWGVYGRKPRWRRSPVVDWERPRTSQPLTSNLYNLYATFRGTGRWPAALLCAGGCKLRKKN